MTMVVRSGPDNVVVKSNIHLLWESSNLFGVNSATDGSCLDFWTFLIFNVLLLVFIICLLFQFCG